MPRKLVLENAHRMGEAMATRFQKYAYAIRLSTLLKDAAAVPRFPERYGMYEHIIKMLSLDSTAIQYLEFGVYEGKSIRFWAGKNQNADSRFWGFDSFEGLPEDWFPGMNKGAFDVGGHIPDVADPRVAFVKGWFNETLLPFLEKQPSNGNQMVLHMDADLYSSTYYVLNALYFHRRLLPGTVIIFDEVVVASIADTEYRAFYDFMQALNIKYELLGIGKFEFAIRIK